MNWNRTKKKFSSGKSHNVRYAKTKQLLLMNEILKPHADKCGVGSSRALYANKSVTTWYSCRDNHFYHNRNHELQWLQSLFAYTYTWINLHTHHNNNKHWIDRQTTSMTKIEAYFFSSCCSFVSLNTCLLVGDLFTVCFGQLSVTNIMWNMCEWCTHFCVVSLNL